MTCWNVISTEYYWIFMLHVKDYRLQDRWVSRKVIKLQNLIIERRVKSCTYTCVCKNEIDYVCEYDSVQFLFYIA